ncbi:hypothetical protein SEMRO_320_G116610.1 [Seminavis robusta]|uniref:Uncharacterized protein n=1 Tax=Seminavis robusta TaxID=568900 RepID=A0A9N8HCI8_9STRA|nr:hypothetical protein SEMRO_320_G116610.1 [Seminavis robusta]|eukprot:Sro320_g116610.1 n/a (333) ;mRNA; r:70374-71590
MDQYHPVKVDLTKPENNREFLVYNLGQTVEGVDVAKGYLYHSQLILYKMDIRYVVDNTEKDYYTCRVSGTNELLVSAPAWDYNQLHYRDFWDGVSRDDDDPEKIVDPILHGMVSAIDDAHDKTIKAKGARDIKHFKLQFPQGCELSSSAIFAEAGEDEWCKLKIIPLVWTHTLSGLSGTDHYAGWVVARKDLESIKKGKPNSKPKAESQAAKLLASLGIGATTGDAPSSKPKPAPKFNTTSSLGRAAASGTKTNSGSKKSSDLMELDDENTGLEGLGAALDGAEAEFNQLVGGNKKHSTKKRTVNEAIDDDDDADAERVDRFGFGGDDTEDY